SMPRWLLALLLSTAPACATPAWGGPLPESASGRRAVRGAPVEIVHESEELRALREFDEQSFPPPLPGMPAAGTYDEGASASASATSSAGVRRASLGNVGPDALPPTLRSPEQELVKPIEPASAIPWLEQIKLPDLPVRLDARVVRYLEFYKSDRRGRAIMTSWLKKQGRWKPLFEDALRRAKLPLGLVYVSMIESGFDPLDRSHAGAVGLWQFMPEGGRIYGLRNDYWIDERRNPEKATEAFVHYIGDLKERFGAWPLTLAAFNAGYGAVLRAMQKYNTNDYWELCKHEDGLPWETTLYVPKAMAVAIVGENKKLFGYDDVVSEPPYAFDRALVPSSTSIAAMAKAAGVSIGEVAALNPELRRNRTPPEPWQARLPRGSGARFAAAWEQHREMVKPFVVRFGERLEDIAAAHGASTRELRALNGIDDSAELRPGLTLVVPDGRKPLQPPPCDTTIVAVPDKDDVVAGRKRVFYRTLPQDSPSDIAAFFKVKPAELARWNNVDLEAKLASNMVLQLWVPSDFDTSKAALVDPSRVRVVTVGSPEFFDLVEGRRGRKRLAYVVKKGDEMKRIAKRFNLTVADLERINRFGAAHSELAVGQKLTVYVPMTGVEKAKAACALTPGGLERDARTKEATIAGKEEIDADKEPTTPKDPIVDEEERAAEGVSVGERAAHGSLPRPPPPDGRP
ncbi:MAG TPA: LysM peptidoglycan-binding domain-containing protein, partial [Polyangia bacterium]|nr:LysM peptidoglycan-binding domain-containing protein [Polyangia bacterium]